jgi:hypothetical protein
MRLHFPRSAIIIFSRIGGRKILVWVESCGLAGGLYMMTNQIMGSDICPTKVSKYGYLDDFVLL